MVATKESATKVKMNVSAETAITRCMACEWKAQRIKKVMKVQTMEIVKHMTPSTVFGIHQTLSVLRKLRVSGSVVDLAASQRPSPVIADVMVENFVRNSIIALTQSSTIERTQRQMTSPRPPFSERPVLRLCDICRR